MKSFTELHAWKIGMQAVKEIYSLTKIFPDSEKFGITSQIQRSSTSILANLAEGFGRRTSPDKSYKYTIARGECSETVAFILISIELGYVTKEKASVVLSLLEETGKLLTGLIQTHSN